MKPHDLKIFHLIVVILSLIALAPMPYGYYTLLKIAVTACAAMTSYLKYKAEDKKFIFWAGILIASIFNPIIPIHLTKETWAVLNILTAGFFSFLWAKLKKQ